MFTPGQDQLERGAAVGRHDLIGSGHVADDFRRLRVRRTRYREKRKGQRGGCPAPHRNALATASERALTSSLAGKLKKLITTNRRSSTNSWACFPAALQNATLPSPGTGSAGGAVG